MSYSLHENDLPNDFDPTKSVAVDTETMGLNLNRDRLCLVQVSNGDGHAHLIKIQPTPKPAPILTSILENQEISVICHFARFDIATLYKAFNTEATNIWCTRTASKLVRTNSEKHGLRDLCQQYLGIEISKEQQVSDWGATDHTPEQLKYAASDVLYLHQLKEKLSSLLNREGRQDIARSCFDFIPTLAKLDTMNWPDIFEH